MTRLLSLLAIMVSFEAVSRAQSPSPNDISITTFDPDQAVAPASSVEGPGVKLGEGTVVHPIFGVETGFVSNVFYTDSNEKPAGLLRLLAQVGIASLSTSRLNPAAINNDDDAATPNKGDFEYRADLRASYDVLLSGNQTVSGTGGLGVGAGLRGMVNPSGTLSFGFDEDFNRLIRAANFETSVNTNRDINNLQLTALLHPAGRSLTGYLYYRNKIDLFERSEQAFADRIDHRVGIHPQWRFLPQTQAYLDVSMGYVSGLGSTASMKVASYPLTALVGIATLLSVKTTLNLEAGYTNGFYSRGPSFSAPVLGAQLGYRYSPLGRILVGYALQYTDSINANYYRDHVLRLQVQQLLAPLLLMVQPEVHFREYNGVTLAASGAVRNDTILAVVAGIHYNFRNWIAATLNYRFTSVQTDYRDRSGGVPDDPSFVRHELLLGMRVAM